MSLSLGGAAPPDPDRLARLARCAEAVGAPLVSEHVAFVRAGGREAGHLLPVPRTRAALDVLVANVRAAQAALPVPLAVENVAALLGWPDDELTDGQFLAELVERTGVGLLLDVANLHTNSVNLGLDPLRALADLPLEAVAYVHVAGGTSRDGVWHDTHTHPVPGEVLALLTELCSRAAVPGVLLERDGAYPPDAELAAELAAIRRAASVPPAPRPATVPARRRRPAGSAGDGDLAAARAALAQAQDGLVAALVSGAAGPAGFDPDRLRVQADALLAKRRDLVARLLPELADEADFPARFAAYVRHCPGPPGGAAADAAAFTRHLRRSGRIRPWTPGTSSSSAR
jgi:uncharacterized protein (UPF0276 family)